MYALKFQMLEPFFLCVYDWMFGLEFNRIAVAAHPHSSEYTHLDVIYFRFMSFVLAQLEQINVHT